MQYTVSFLLGAVLTFACLTIVSPSPQDLTALHRRISSSHSTELENHQCPFPIVYNKPPKTAGTYVQTLITNWAAQTGRGNFLCGGRRAVETSVYLQECVPRDDDGCGVVNCHLHLTPESKDILRRRLPNYRALTTTRYPAHRIVSLFLQLNLFKSNEIKDHVEMEKLLQYFLQYKFNPWTLYNFHTGQYRKGSCPLRRVDTIDIFRLAGQYDLVVDANLPKVSNDILRDHGLFQFPNIADEKNVRGAAHLSLSDETKQMIRNVSCVEDALHKALHLRMASLYEKATGKPCIEHGRIEELSSCLLEMEQRSLNSSWRV